MEASVENQDVLLAVEHKGVRIIITRNKTGPPRFQVALHAEDALIEHIHEAVDGLHGCMALLEANPWADMKEG